MPDPRQTRGRRHPANELDDAVEAMIKGPAASVDVSPGLADLLRLAADLRDLPRQEFQRRLKAALFPEAPSYGRVLVTEDDIRARLAELAEPRLVAHDLGAALADLPDMTMRFLTQLNDCTIGVSRGSTRSHWERHPAGDEMLHFLQGEADIVTLTEDGPIDSTVRAGSIFICPQGLWHQLRPRAPISMLFATPGAGTETTDADAQPRPQHRARSRRRSDSRRRQTEAPSLVAHDLADALSGIPELVITPETTGEDVDAAVRPITTLGPCMVGVMRYAGQTPWERHPDGDELLHVLEGAVEVSVLTDDGPTHVRMDAGSVFVCPRGLWHRQLPQPSVTMLFGTPSETTEVSFAEDPRA